MNVNATININGTLTAVKIVDVTTNGVEVAVTYVVGSVLYLIIMKRDAYGNSNIPLQLGTAATVI